MDLAWEFPSFLSMQYRMGFDDANKKPQFLGRRPYFSCRWKKQGPPKKSNLKEKLAPGDATQMAQQGNAL